MGCSDSAFDIESQKKSSSQFTRESQFQVYAAIMKDDVALLKHYLNSGFLIDYAMPCFNNRTLLHIAALHGKSECLCLLLSLKANINAKDPFNITPLMLAIENNSNLCIELLIKSGARSISKGLNDIKIKPGLSTKRSSRKTVSCSNLDEFLR